MHWRHVIAAVLVLFASAATAQTTVRIGYQPTPGPAQLQIVDKVYDRAFAALDAKIEWRRFESGASVIAALAAGAIDIGYAGSSPLAAGVTRSLPIKAFLIADRIGRGEALVVRNGAGIEKPADLEGRKVATPFVSTAHYSLLFALRHWGIDQARVQLLNLQPSEIAAAFARGDIDAAYVWEPALANILKNGKILATSEDVAQWGGPTFDSWITRDAFARAHPDIVAAFTRVTLDAFAAYRKDPGAYGPGSDAARKIGAFSGADWADAPDQIAGNSYPLADEQVSDALLGRGTAAAIASTSVFLKEQRKLDSVLPDYAFAVTTEFVRKASAAQ